MGVATLGAAITATVSTVADGTSSVTILAADDDRAGGSIVNNSSALLYIRVGGGTAAIAAGGFSAILGASGGYFEIPYRFTGAITGIWASDAGGYANCTTYTAA